ncbi:hydrolase [Enterococcus sp. JM4C]|uniref:endonuclease/exonuclease/phosphatase family protein n=1 Tax=Candidatus Enterococcus huntleyi TaxID=1857217 RepID=UPI00137A21DB|nr:endonuclease/exonuclease/phosphatase family protein [Enterococcus sp. JM4C]KAF1295559.1 hydrolase [Enterococcus sp. JM4C]
MKILTLNTHSWIEENPLEKLEELAQSILAMDADVIGLQEVNQLIKAETIELNEYFHAAENQAAIKKDNFAYLLVERLKELGIIYHWCWMSSHIGYDIYEEGAAILSKTPLVAESLIVSESIEFTDYHTRRVVGAVTTVDEEEIYVLSSHFSWWIDETNGFSREWRTTEAHLATKQLPLFVVGDLNNPAHINDEGYRLVENTDLALSDSFVAAEHKLGEATIEKVIDGWEGNTENLRIDYIFVPQKFHVEHYEVVFNGQRTSIVSDHFGVLVSGKLK